MALEDLANTKNDREPEDEECELTNLNWLTELKNVGYIAELAEGPVDVPLTRFNKFLDELKLDQDKYKRDLQIYQQNGDDKPPFNYAHLIGLSLLENGRMTLQQVYDWIQDNFLYYKLCGTNWQSSIRHNLSLGFFFKNTARGDNERGKGGYWELALDSRKTEWKRNRKSRKNRHHQSSLNQEKIHRRYSLKSNSNSYSSKKACRKRLKYAKRDKKEVYKDENDETSTREADTDSPRLSTTTELILTVEASEECFRITEDTPVDFVDDFNLNNQIFQANEVPQPMIDDIEVPFFSSHSSNSPNVIVETLPYNLPLEEYNFTTSFNEQKIFEDLLEYENELM